MWHQGKHEHRQSQSRPSRQNWPQALVRQLWAQVGWLALLPLPAWSYHFRQFADGRWDADCATIRIEYAPFAA